MGKLGEIWRRLGMLARRDVAARELDEEMGLHREMKKRERIAKGLDEEEARLVRIEENHDGLINVTGATFVDLFATPLRSIDKLGAYRLWPFNVNGGAEPVQTDGAMISAGLFEVLGARPELGRQFSADEER